MTTLLVVAGEASGDLHGAELLRELKAREPGLRIIGVGGAGMTPYLDRKLADVGELGVVGFVEVLRHIPKLLALKKEILRVAVEEKIDAALLIDYQSFNLSLAKSLRKALPSVRLHQYVCPQVWAWKAGRIPVMGRLFDALYCLFDFEPRLFQGLPVEALWVGNPLVETVRPEVDRETFFHATGLDPSARWWPCCRAAAGRRSSAWCRPSPSWPRPGAEIPLIAKSSGCCRWPPPWKEPSSKVSWRAPPSFW